MRESKPVFIKSYTQFGITLLTFFVGTVLALVWITIDNKSVEFVEAQSRPSKVEVPVSDKIPEIPKAIAATIQGQS